jgi:tellurite methyltransferase
MLTPDYQRNWPAYFDAVAQQPPRQTLLTAIEHLATCDVGLMVDLACGSGRDTLALLRAKPGWHVIALDTSEDGLARLHANVVDATMRARLQSHVVAMEDVPGWWRSQRPARPAPMLINASFALPFCDPARFPALWAWLCSTLATGGCFAGQLFGDRDDWATIRPASHFSREAALGLLAPFKTLMFDEVDKPGSDAMGGCKHHHLYHIVARKPEKPRTPA